MTPSRPCIMNSETHFEPPSRWAHATSFSIIGMLCILSLVRLRDTLISPLSLTQLGGCLTFAKPFSHIVIGKACQTMPSRSLRIKSSNRLPRPEEGPKSIEGKYQGLPMVDDQALAWRHCDTGTSKHSSNRRQNKGNLKRSFAWSKAAAMKSMLTERTQDSKV